jgi:hypothetical protein
VHGRPRNVTWRHRKAQEAPGSHTGGRDMCRKSLGGHTEDRTCARGLGEVTQKDLEGRGAHGKADAEF